MCFFLLLLLAGIHWLIHIFRIYLLISPRHSTNHRRYNGWQDRHSFCDQGLHTQANCLFSAFPNPSRMNMFYFCPSKEKNSSWLQELCCLWILFSCKFASLVLYFATIVIISICSVHRMYGVCQLLSPWIIRRKENLTASQHVLERNTWHTSNFTWNESISVF